MKDEIGQLLDKNKTIVNAARTEKRSLTATEQSEFDDNLLQIRELDLDLEKEMRSSSFVPGKKVSQAIPGAQSQFSLIKAIRSKLDGKNYDELSTRIFEVGRNELRASGHMPAGDLVIPVEIRADVLAGTATQGQEIVAEQKMAILPPLENKLVLAAAGATYLTGLVGNVSIPSYSGTTVAWKGEVIAADDGAGTFGEVGFSPKRLTAYLDVSKLFLAQDSVGAERMLLDNIASAVARKLESTILGVAAGSATQPQGMGYKITTGTDTKAAKAAATNKLLVALETAIDSANALANKLGYITNASGRGILKTTLKETGLPGYICSEAGQVNGYPLYVTNGCSGAAGTDAGDLVVFGNWADLCIGQWGGFDITVDPFTVAKENKVRIVINAYFDAKGLRGSAPTDVHGEATTQADDYAISFASLAIKA